MAEQSVWKDPRLNAAVSAVILDGYRAPPEIVAIRILEVVRQHLDSAHLAQKPPEVVQITTTSERKLMRALQRDRVVTGILDVRVMLALTGRGLVERRYHDGEIFVGVLSGNGRAELDHFPLAKEQP